MCAYSDKSKTLGIDNFKLSVVIEALAGRVLYKHFQMNPNQSLIYSVKDLPWLSGINIEVCLNLYSWNKEAQENLVEYWPDKFILLLVLANGISKSWMRMEPKPKERPILSTAIRKLT